MKILWISQAVADDNAGPSLARVSMRDALERAGHRVHLVLGTRTSRAVKRDDGIELWPCTSLSDKFRFNQAALQAIRSTDADVVLLHQDFQVVVGLIARSLRRIKRVAPIVMDIRTLPIHDTGTVIQRARWLRFRWCVGAASRFLEGVTTITPAMTDFLVAEHWLEREKTLGEWSSGVSAFPQTVPPPLDLKQKLSSLPRPIGVYLGVLAENRGLEDLIHAAERPDFLGSLVVIGSGPIEAELRSLSGAQKPNVLFTGRLPQQEAWSALRECDYGVCLLPNLLWWRVSSPLKVLEYLAAGLPVLASSPVHQALLAEYDGALLLGEIEPAAISAATQKMLELPPSEEQREAILRRYSWNSVAKDLVAALEKVVP